jgi:hypothetical protein
VTPTRPRPGRSAAAGRSPHDPPEASGVPAGGRPDPEAVAPLPLPLLREIVGRLSTPAALAQAHGEELAAAIRAAVADRDGRARRPHRPRRPRTRRKEPE